MWAFRSARVAAAFRPAVAARRPSALPAVRYQSQYYRRRPQYNRFQKTGNFFTRWAARPTFYYEVGGLGAAVGGFYVYNLEVVPVSGRRRFNVVSPEREKSMSQEMYAEVMREYQGKILPPWDRRVQLVQRVLDRLIPASGLHDERWEVHVIDSPEMNAFVIPGGKVFVFSGILPICRNEDGLAAVLGHEIAHNIAHHSAERMSQSIFVFAAALAIDIFLGGTGGITRMLLDLTFLKPGSRSQESEADFIGLMMMAQSCFNPEEAAALWARMEKAEQVAVPQFISTHPSSHNRQQKILEWLPEAREKQAQGDCGAILDYADAFRRKFRSSAW
ncbi:Peptidase M48 [Lasiodiplodia theobromae]|uniref:Mitochondrial metalloendopeptidase OMA1 n=1 Tax=Lasiodiplodia theobromae TaxID=45133 RepID=A0A5N5DPC3_9PEZI|nr:Peptidase M48 [Lasiodiplodia theobromae]KAB2578742.1 Mitochondrial metalloendopeptidase OMA1 [Lasiodiplodia theobromae]KAF4535344.1 Peptidase M48 [Lasiodiplodia theobromae]KAF9638620.1 Peptidase M48 [Lasiodiplodia theobromae]